MRGVPRTRDSGRRPQDPPRGRSAVRLEATGSGEMPGTDSGPAHHFAFRAPDASGRASAHGWRPRTTPRPSRRRRSLGGWNRVRCAEGEADRSGSHLGVGSDSGVTATHVGVRPSPRGDRAMGRGVGRRGRRATPHGFVTSPRGRAVHLVLQRNVNGGSRSMGSRPRTGEGPRRFPPWLPPWPRCGSSRPGRKARRRRPARSSRSTLPRSRSTSVSRGTERRSPSSRGATPRRTGRCSSPTKERNPRGWSRCGVMAARCAR